MAQKGENIFGLLGEKPRSFLEDCMVSTSRKEALELAKDDAIMEKYVKEAKFVENGDNGLREAYDHELSARIAEREAGFDDGYENGYGSGYNKGQNQIISFLLEKGKSKKDISESTGLTLDEVENIISRIESDD